MDTSRLGAHPIGASEGHAGPVDNFGIAGVIDGLSAAGSRRTRARPSSSARRVTDLCLPAVSHRRQVRRSSRPGAKRPAPATPPRNPGANCRHARHSSGPRVETPPPSAPLATQEAKHRHPQHSSEPRSRNAGSHDTPRDPGGETPPPATLLRTQEPKRRQPRHPSEPRSRNAANLDTPNDTEAEPPAPLTRLATGG
jgi:hypothetical protein